MSDFNLRRRLTSMDAAFLYAETDEQPMHVGAVCIVEGKLTHRKFVRDLIPRLDLVPRYHQRLAFPPLNIGHPTWEKDPDFNIEKHVFLEKLPGAADDEELRKFTGRFWSTLLPRDKPLWEAVIIENLSDNRSAVIFKVHHCMIDGVSGVGLLYILMDLDPNPPKLRRKPYKAAPLPEPAAQLYDALWDSAIDGVEHWTRFQRSLVDFGRGFDVTGLANSLKKFGGTLGSFLLPFKPMPFNRPLNGERAIAWREFAFADVRKIRQVLGGTINDVVLAALGGAVAKYLERHPDADPKDFDTLRVLAPVNVRTENERGALGNRISFMPVQVPLLSDPRERLHAISDVTLDLKSHKIPEAIGLMFEFLQGSPALVQALSLNTVTKPLVQMAAGTVSLLPLGNLVCTNVPGPQIPLYTMGHRILALYPKVPCALEMGINFALMSYDQKLFVTLVADAQAAPDYDVMMDCFEESFIELRTAAEVDEAEYLQLSAPPRNNTGNGNGRPSRRRIRAAAASKATKH